MHTVSIVALLLAGSPGSTVRAGALVPPITTPHLVQVQSAAPLISTYAAEDDYTITTAKWVTHSVGVGLGSQTLTLLVGGATACTITVPCLAAAGTKVSATCNAPVLSGQDVDWTRSGCSTAALGAITYQVLH